MFFSEDFEQSHNDVMGVLNSWLTPAKNLSFCLVMSRRRNHMSVRSGRRAKPLAQHAAGIPDTSSSVVTQGRVGSVRVNIMQQHLCKMIPVENLSPVCHLGSEKDQRVTGSECNFERLILGLEVHRVSGRTTEWQRNADLTRGAIPVAIQSIAALVYPAIAVGGEDAYPVIGQKVTSAGEQYLHEGIGVFCWRSWDLRISEWASKSTGPRLEGYIVVAKSSLVLRQERTSNDVSVTNKSLGEPVAS